MIIEHTKFNKRFLLPDELVEQFIATHYNLAADCNFREVKGKSANQSVIES